MEDYRIESTIDGNLFTRRFMRIEHDEMIYRFDKIAGAISNLWYAGFIDTFQLFLYRMEGNRKVFVLEQSWGSCDISRRVENEQD